MTLNQAQKWLRAGSAVAIAAGLLMATGASGALNGPLMVVTDLFIWPLDQAQTGEAAEFRLMSAIAGGVMVGWGALLWLLAGRGLAEAPALTRDVIMWSTPCWFVVDTTGSLVANAPVNAGVNVVFLLMIVVPVWAYRP